MSRTVSAPHLPPLFLSRSTSIWLLVIHRWDRVRSGYHLQRSRTQISLMGPWSCTRLINHLVRPLSLGRTWADCRDLQLWSCLCESRTSLWKLVSGTGRSSSALQTRIRPLLTSVCSSPQVWLSCHWRQRAALFWSRSLQSSLQVCVNWRTVMCCEGPRVWPCYRNQHWRVGSSWMARVVPSWCCLSVHPWLRQPK